MSSSHTRIYLVIDTSGSMRPIVEKTIESVNNLLAEQKTEGDDALVTLIEFNSSVHVLYTDVPIADVPVFTMAAGGMTALHDAMGKALELAEAAREASLNPFGAMFVVVTDGDENVSRAWTAEKLRSAIPEIESREGWRFLFLGANQDAILTAGSLGIKGSAAASWSTGHVDTAGRLVSGKLGAYRGVSRGAYSANADLDVKTSGSLFDAAIAMTPEERDALINGENGEGEES